MRVPLPLARVCLAPVAGGRAGRRLGRGGARSARGTARQGGGAAVDAAAGAAGERGTVPERGAARGVCRARRHAPQTGAGEKLRDGRPPEPRPRLGRRSPPAPDRRVPVRGGVRGRPRRRARRGTAAGDRAARLPGRLPAPRQLGASVCDCGGGGWRRGRARGVAHHGRGRSGEGACRARSAAGRPGAPAGCRACAVASFGGRRGQDGGRADGRGRRRRRGRRPLLLRPARRALPRLGRAPGGGDRGRVRGVGPGPVRGGGREVDGTARRAAPARRDRPPLFPLPATTTSSPSPPCNALAPWPSKPPPWRPCRPPRASRRAARRSPRPPAASPGPGWRP